MEPLQVGVAGSYFRSPEAAWFRSPEEVEVYFGSPEEVGSYFRSPAVAWFHSPVAEEVCFDSRLEQAAACFGNLTVAGSHFRNSEEVEACFGSPEEVEVAPDKYSLDSA
jgi:hypothetical protein